MNTGDVLRIAAQMVAEFGDRAAAVANGRAKNLVRLGNTEGAASWLKVVAAIEEFSRKPNEDEPLH